MIEGQDAQIADMTDQEIESAVNPQATETQTNTSPWNEDTFTVGGKEVKGSREQILKWAAMGHGYPQKAQEFNQLKSKLDSYLSREKDLSEKESKYKPYQEIDEYASKNPEWWTEVQNSYKQKISGAQSNPEMQAIMKELEELKKFRDEHVSEKEKIKIESEDKQLNEEIESIRKAHPNMDFDTPDEEGKSLEAKVIEHAQQNGISTFRAAFRDYCHDQLVSKASEQGKETVAKEVQKRSKLGIVSETKQPTKGLKIAENVRHKSYAQLKQEALEELGMTGG